MAKREFVMRALNSGLLPAPNNVESTPNTSLSDADQHQHPNGCVDQVQRPGQSSALTTTTPCSRP